MSTDAFSWLHLTDCHYGLNGQDCLWPTLREPFLESLEALHQRCGPWQAVLFTGDLVQSGEPAQFGRMQAEVLDPLWEKLTALGSGDAVLLAVPGNHDLYRPRTDLPDFDDPARETLVRPGGFDNVEAKFWQQPGGTYRRAINGAFAAYTEWWEKAPRRPVDLRGGALPGDFSATMPCNGRRVGIVGLNTTFLQLAGGNYEGRLVWDARQLHALCDNGVDRWTKQHDVCLLLTHQGPNWLTPQARKHGEADIAPAGRFAVHLFGHQHETSIRRINEGGSTRATRLWQGCSVFGMEKFGESPQVVRSHGYAAGRIEFGAEQTVLRLWPRVATRNTGRWRFIPDHSNAELESDEGTAPDLISSPVPATPRPTIRSASGAARVITSAFVPRQETGARSSGDADGETHTPGPPEFYAEPPYIGSHDFIGRDAQLEELSDWARPADPTNLPAVRGDRWQRQKHADLGMDE